MLGLPVKNGVVMHRACRGDFLAPTRKVRSTGAGHSTGSGARSRSAMIKGSSRPIFIGR